MEFQNTILLNQSISTEELAQISRQIVEMMDRIEIEVDESEEIVVRQPGEIVACMSIDDDLASIQIQHDGEFFFHDLTTQLPDEGFQVVEIQ